MAVTRVNPDPLDPLDLSDVTLRNDKYYILTMADNPLFDSFTIDFDVYRNTVVISVFRVTASERYEGSAKGYPLIRKIMTRVCGFLTEEGRNSKIEVAYFLVCPDDGSQHEWKMPGGWGEAVKTCNHRGHAFCIRVPVPAPQSASCLFTPNFAT